MLKRTFDVTMALTAILFLSLPILLVALLVKLTSPGPILYWSDRVGRNNTIFKMPKFRTMLTDTPAVATHLLSDPIQCKCRNYLIPCLPRHSYWYFDDFCGCIRHQQLHFETATT